MRLAIVSTGVIKFAPIKMGELGSPLFWVPKRKIGIKTLGPLKSKHSGLFYGGRVLIPIPYFDSQNEGEPKEKFNGGKFIPPVNTI